MHDQSTINLRSMHESVVLEKGLHNDFLLNKPKQIMDSVRIAEELDRLAKEIAIFHSSADSMVLVGIQRGGVPLANRLAEKLFELLGHLVAVGSLDVSLHRDDLTGRSTRELLPTNLPFDVSGRTVLLVDDVLFTGRTVRAAMDTLNDYGRPARIQLAVLIDRGHRELPITADFVGHQMTTTFKQKVRVEWGGNGGEERVVLEE